MPTETKIPLRNRILTIPCPSRGKEVCPFFPTFKPAKRSMLETPKMHHLRLDLQLFEQDGDSAPFSAVQLNILSLVAFLTEGSSWIVLYWVNAKTVGNSAELSHAW